METSSFGSESAEARESEQRGASAAVSTDRGRCCEDPRARLWADQTMRGRLRLRGMGISPGLAVGPAFIYRDLFQRDIERPSIELHEIAEETARIKEAVDEVLDGLEETAHRIEGEIDAEHAAIFWAQAEMLRSGSILRELRNELETELLNAEQVVKRVLRRLERRFQEAAHPILQERSDDIADLACQLLAALAGIHVHTLETLPEGSVVVARRLLPSDTVMLSRRRTSAVVLEHAGPTSHAALLARALAIPAVGQAPGIIERVRPGEILLVDGFEGEVLVDPDEDVRKSFASPGQRYATAILARRPSFPEPAVTKDGARIHVMANVGCGEDVAVAASYGADGIGLFRTEFLYLTRRSAPTEDELYEQMIEALAPMKGRPITLRLLDAGGDKLLPFLRLPAGPNPALGKRGVRVLRDKPDLLMAHLRASLRLSAEHDIRILIPMVTLPSEIEWVRDSLEKAAAESGVDRLPPLGAMIETPAAALCADLMAPHADFFSLGTNDLTQYVMAAGREDPFVAEYYQEDHPAVRRLVDAAIRSVPGMPVELCGEAAGRPETLAAFLKMGITTISLAPPLIPLVKDALRELTL
jgi:phosphoenolpyruvate-protein phosphotransferase (PTS system enzyme I)